MFVADTLPGERVLARLSDTTHGRFFRAETVSRARGVARPAAARLVRGVRRPRPGGPGRRRRVRAHHAGAAAGAEDDGAARRPRAHRADGCGAARRARPAGAGRAGAARRHALADPHPPARRRRRPGGAVRGPDPPRRDRRRPPARRARAGGPAAVGAAGSRVRSTSSRRRRGRPSRCRTAPRTRPSGSGSAIATFALEATGFWQVHPAAPAVLTAAVGAAVDRDRFDPRAGNLDLYGGVGLLAAALGDLGGPTTVVTTRRGGPAGEPARSREPRRAGAVPGRSAPVSTCSSRRENGPRPGATVVLDPPRSGVGRAVVEGVAALAPGADRLRRLRSRRARARPRDLRRARLAPTPPRRLRPVPEHAPLRGGRGPGAGLMLDPHGVRRPELGDGPSPIGVHPSVRSVPRNP